MFSFQPTDPQQRDNWESDQTGEKLGAFSATNSLNPTWDGDADPLASSLAEALGAGATASGGEASQIDRMMSASVQEEKARQLPRGKDGRPLPVDPSQGAGDRPASLDPLEDMFDRLRFGH